MPSYDQIEDEEELHKLMNATDSFDERKKIRARLREIREKQRAEMEARRVQREKETEDLVRKKFEKAEEEKKRKMEAFQSQKPTCERDSQYHATADKAVLDKKKQADEEKAKKLQAYSQISERKTPEGATVRTSTTTTTVKSEDGSTTVTKKTETSVKQTSGFGGVQYGRPGAAPGEEMSGGHSDAHQSVTEAAEGSEPPLDKQGGSCHVKQDQDQTSEEKVEESANNKQEDVQAPTENILIPADNPKAEDAVKTKSSDKDTDSDGARKDGNQTLELSQGKSEETPRAENLTLDTAGAENPERDTAEGGDPQMGSARNGHQKLDTAAGSHQKMDPEGDPNLAAADASRKPDESAKVKVKPDAATVTSGATAKAAELNARTLKEQLSRASGPGTSGSITVKTQSWSSKDGVIHKAHKTESWGAKPQGPRGAMAAFKQMDANSPSRPNEGGEDRGLVTVSLAKRAANTMRKNAVAIKQEILSFVQINTEGYKNVEVTNFSTCWNDGMAFCALIHHFFPDAFDFSQLEPKNRRYNFELAFDTAEKMADISPLLDVEDMVKMKNPDWKCVFTYVQSIYRHLRDHENNKARIEA